MRLLLVRHAHTAAVGRTLAGRAPGLGLSAAGRAEAAALGAALASAPLAAVYASPLARARETAAAIARPHGVRVDEAPGLIEIDYGAWTGRAIDAFAADDVAWRSWNAARDTATIPGGEAFVAVSARVEAAMQSLAHRHAGADVGATIVAVSHADVVRAALGVALGIPGARQLALDVAPASVSVLDVAPWGMTVRAVNARAG